LEGRQRIRKKSFLSDLTDLFNLDYFISFVVIMFSKEKLKNDFQKINKNSNDK